MLLKAIARTVLDNSSVSATLSPPAGGEVEDAQTSAHREGLDEQLNELFHLDERLADPAVAALFPRVNSSFNLREGERKKKRAQPTAFELFGDPAAASAAAGGSTELYILYQRSLYH